MKIFAHRGNSSAFVENSRKAFESCKNMDIYGTELDVQLSKDSEIIVFHDEDIYRLLGEKGFLKDYTLEELKKFKYEDGQEILTLEEYINIVKDTDLVTNVELKTGIFKYKGIEEKTYELFKKYDMVDRLLISSFNHESILRFKKIAPEVEVAFLEMSVLAEPEEYLKKYGVSTYHPLFATMNKALVENLHENDIKVNAWTVNNKEYFDFMVDMGVDGIITDYPELNFK